MILQICKLLFFTSLLSIGPVVDSENSLLTQSSDDSSYPYEVNTHYKLTAAGFGPSYEGPGESLRFSTAFDKNFHIFKNNFVDHTNTNVSFYRSCLDLCDSYDHCNGLFYNYGDQTNCIGLSYLGKLSLTQTRSISLTKVRLHKMHTHTHDIKGFVYNQGEFDNHSHVYLDLNLNGNYDANEPLYRTESDGFYEFNNLSFINYVLRQHNLSYPYNCSQLYPDRNGSVIDYLNHSLYQDGFPDVVVEYKDTGQGVMGGGDGGDPHGGKIVDLLNNEGVSIKDTLKAISSNVILGNNTEYVMVLPNSSYIILGFSSENILINNTFSLDVNILYELNNEDSLNVYVSENNKDYVYLGMVNENKNSFKMDELREDISVLRYVKLVARTGNGIVKGVPLVNVYVNHTETGTLQWAHNVYLPQNKNESVEDVNFTNFCYLPDPTTSITTTTTTTSTTTTITSTTTTEAQTTTTLPQQPTARQFPTTTSSANVSQTTLENSGFDLLLLIPILLGSFVLVGGVYALVRYIIKKRTENKLHRIEATQNMDLSSRTFSNPLYVPTEPATFPDNQHLYPRVESFAETPA